jgi:hypothetical protein
MSQHQLTAFARFEAGLWEAADQLRANSKLTSSEYCMWLLGVTFLHRDLLRNRPYQLVETPDEPGHSRN